MSEERIEGFLGRWSRLKRSERSDEEDQVAPDAGSAPTGNAAAPDGEPRAAAADNARGEAGTESDDGAPGEPARDFSDFDYDKLGYESDYEQFMKANVPDDVRNTALRKLWVSNPVLANIDGLDDYCEDYTDAAMCLPKGTMKTAYKFGRGFLSDAEVAQWEALGKPANSVDAETEVAAAEPGEPPAAVASTEAATAAAAVPEIATGEVAAAADPNDWAESAATGAGCAAALNAQERAAELEDDSNERASDERSSPAGQSKT